MPERPNFAGVLAEHREDYSEHCCYWHDGCTCGWTDATDDSESSKEAYDAHLAAALAAEVNRWLADERTREVVARAMAIEGDYDGCFLRRDDALAVGDTDWADAEEEDCQWWTTRATTALVALTTDTDQPKENA